MIARVLLLLCVAAAAFSAPCANPLHYWIEESKTLTTSLSTPPTINTDVHNTLYPDVPVGNQGALMACPTPLTYVLLTSPTKHTGTPTTYTPYINSTFAVSSTGAFDYLNLPNHINPVVWNGFDSFTVEATCAGNPTTCTATVYVSVVFTSAASQNAAVPSFQNGYTNGVSCTGSCNVVADGLWLARHTLPRLWDVQTNEAGNSVKPTLTGTTTASDLLEFEWSSNYAIVSTYGAIGNMAVRFPTFELLRWGPGDMFATTPGVAIQSTGFNQACLAYQPATGAGSDVFAFNNAQTDGTSQLTTSGASWYQKFNGKHFSCDAFTGMNGSISNVCQYAPLLAPRTTTDEDDAGVWRLTVSNCNLKWQGKFTWNAMRNQTLNNGNKAWAITNNNNDYTITSEMYNQAVQPNSWTQPSRGYASIDHKYLLKVVLSGDTDFEFELGVDIFTVDLQHFRYFDGSGNHAFGYNMIVYPVAVKNLEPNQAPDRRIEGYTWVEQEWVAPTSTQCPGCNTGGIGEKCTLTAAASSAAYTGGMQAGTCPSTNNPVVTLSKGPSTPTTACTNAGTDILTIFSVPGVSRPSESTAATVNCAAAGFQNITLRGVAEGSSALTFTNLNNGFGFEGKITLTFELKNGEHPHFVLTPKMYVKSICIDGAFAGSSSTCRGSPSWPVANSTQLPEYVCEEVDARTFGPTDWAIIFFDIKDVDADLVSVQALSIKIGTLTVVFEDASTVGFTIDAKYAYFNYRNLKSRVGFNLASPTAPAGVSPPLNMDFGFAFTAGAHNENAKITIYCTLRIAQSKLGKSRRFASAAAEDAHNTVQERISIQNKYNQQLSAEAQRVVEQRSSTSSANTASSSSSSGSVTVIVLAAACAVLLAAVIGMVLYVVRQRNSANIAPKRVNSQA